MKCVSISVRAFRSREILMPPKHTRGFVSVRMHLKLLCSDVSHWRFFPASFTKHMSVMPCSLRTDDRQKMELNNSTLWKPLHVFVFRSLNRNTSEMWFMSCDLSPLILHPSWHKSLFLWQSVYTRKSTPQSRTKQNTLWKVPKGDVLTKFHRRCIFDSSKNLSVDGS